MGIGRICDRQYGYMTAPDCLDNLDGPYGAGGEHSYIKRDHFSKERLVTSTQNGSWTFESQYFAVLSGVNSDLC